MGIVWIASYPKSGNTWMRFLLANYFAGPIRDSAAVEHLIPGFHHLTDGRGLVRERGTVYGKTHYVWSPRHPSGSLTDRAILVVRNPKDVLLSNLRFRRMATGTDKGFSDEAYARSFIQNGGDARWVEEDFGTFEQHASSWLDGMEESRRLVLRYEDLKADCSDALCKALTFLGVPIDPQRLDLAIANSSFEQMRAIEVREKREHRNGIVFPGPAPRPGWVRYFMSSGQVRGSLRHISPSLDDAFGRRFGGVMARLGYLSGAAS